MTTVPKPVPVSAPIRRITVNRMFYDYKPKNPSPSYVGTAPVPWLQMKGKWLARAGFTIGTSVNIEVTEGRLVLTAL